MCFTSEEYFLANPSGSPQLTFQVGSIMACVRFKLPASSLDLSSKVKQDPFAKLPYVAICKILHQLPAGCLIDMLRASWTVYARVRDKHCFWKEALEKNMPWFYEVQELWRLGALRRPEHYRAIYLWAERTIWPRIFLSGPLMYVANRRRIWATAEVLADVYCGCFGTSVIPRWDDD
ncbi:hypothetical protein F5Y02DRAFT_180310 [Annulohypoxylon stygium]|nr:hypothetical protein F5Y02DRAFT_180310 [Annulohypoxylon stygium]